MQERVTYRLEDSIATITLDDGSKNVLSAAAFSELGAALDRAEADRAVVVLTGREGIFSAGFDLKSLGAGPEEAYAMVRAGFDLAARLLAFPAPVVVACTGHAIAMGSFLLLSGDYRLGAAGPFKIGANEVAIGLVMPYFGVEICRQRLSPAYFHRAVVNAEMFRPEEAAVAGFLDRVVPAAELSAMARAVATDLRKLDPTVHTATKLRARAAAIAAVRAAIDGDADVFRGRAAAAAAS
jgi:enoyl-CoA hydratase